MDLRFWNKKKPEKRDSLTSRLIDIAEASASGETIVQSSSPIEAVAGLYGRCFASAKVNDPRLTAEVLSDIARSMIKFGESLFYVSREETVKVVEYTITSTQPANEIPLRKFWVYDCTFSSPMVTNRSLALGPNKIFHVRYSYSYKRPYEGRSPLYLSPQAQRLSVNIERIFSEMTAAEIAQIVTMPRLDANKAQEIANKVRDAKGKTRFVETTAHAFGKGVAEAPRMHDWASQTIAPKPDQYLVELYKQAQDAIFKACGVPLALMSEGSGQREAMRHFVATAIEPLSRIIAQEWKRTTGVDIEFDFSTIRSTDLAAKARAFKMFVSETGLSSEIAAKICGINLED